MLDSLQNAGQLLIVLLGFGGVILIHELGHFLAARWAGVRVLEFAIGFGPAIASYRKGLGIRARSSSAEFERLERRGEAAGISPTEYRLNWIPLGGYVRMLGQDDTNPAATSNASDSYQTKPVWKRLVIISAGVVMNIILAAILFIAVFMAGMQAPTAVIGAVRPGSPAALAAPVNGAERGVSEAGLRPGDRVVTIDGERVFSFKDVFAGAAMAPRGRALPLEVERPGVDGLLRFAIEPREGAQSRLLELGVAPALSPRLAAFEGGARAQANHRELIELSGLGAAAPGMSVVSAGGEPASYAHDVTRAVEAAAGAPVDLVLQDAAGREITTTVRAEPRLGEASSIITTAAGVEERPVEHLLGLAPAVRLQGIEEGSRPFEAGLRSGDVVAQIGAVEWPNTASLVEEVRRYAGRKAPIAVVRDGRIVALEAPVSGQGQLGVYLEPTSSDLAVVTRPPRAKDGAAFAASALDLPPGSTLVRVGETDVASLDAARLALADATLASHRAGGGAAVDLTVRLPIGDAPGAGPVETMAWTLSAADVRMLHGLGWRSPVDERLFEIAEDTLKAESPLAALAMGASETKRVVVMTYVTLLRLFEGTVRVEHLKGPVGITHLGTQVVEQGFVSLLFFFAVISANLAVLNFLPLPIVDGGHAVFLLIEGVTKRPVSVRVQNIAMLIGIALIGTMFLVVTFNDIAALFAG